MWRHAKHIKRYAWFIQRDERRDVSEKVMARTEIQDLNCIYTHAR